MKIETLKERIAKKEAQIEKKQNTIANKTKGIANKKAKFEKAEEGTYEYNCLHWDIVHLEDDIERLHSEIEEAKATLEKYEKQLAGEIAKEEAFIKEVPEQVKDMEQMLIKRWDESEKARREFLRNENRELGYSEFIKKHSYTEYDFIMWDDEKIHNKNVKDARTFVLDLVNRTKDITGEITSWNDVYLTAGTNGIPVLNGIVIGKEGRAEVESILAGGYNIQRLHVRVLVKAC